MPGSRITAIHMVTAWQPRIEVAAWPTNSAGSHFLIGLVDRGFTAARIWGKKIYKITPMSSDGHGCDDLNDPRPYSGKYPIRRDNELSARFPDERRLHAATFFSGGARAGLLGVSGRSTPGHQLTLRCVAPGTIWQPGISPFAGTVHGRQLVPNASPSTGTYQQTMLH